MTVSVSVEKYRPTINLSDEQFMLMGKISAHWSITEWVLMRLIEHLLQTGPKEAQVLASGMTAMEKARVIKLLARLCITDSKKLNELEDVLKRVDEARVARNDIAHGLWTTDKDGELHIMKYRGGSDEINRIKGNPIRMSIEDLRAKQEMVQNAMGGLLFWWGAEHLAKDALEDEQGR